MTGSPTTPDRNGFERWLSDVPLLLRDPLEKWLEPRLEGLAAKNRRSIVDEVSARARVDPPAYVSATRPLEDLLHSLKVLRSGSLDLGLPTGVPALAGALVDGRNTIAHLRRLEIDDVLSVLGKCIELLEALGAARDAEPLNRRREMLEGQVRCFPFPGVAGGCGPRTLFVAPCSAHKRKFPDRSEVAPGPHDVPSELRRSGATEVADALMDERERIAGRAGLNVEECGLLPAHERYSEGTLWAGPDRRKTLHRAVESGANLCFISGAYGVVHAREPIGYYDIELADAGWSRGVIEKALAEYASALRVDRIVALLRVPAYQRIARNAPWRSPVRNVDILSPDAPKAPAASDVSLGEALEVLVAGKGELPRAWVSTDGAMLMREKVR